MIMVQEQIKTGPQARNVFQLSRASQMMTRADKRITPRRITPSVQNVDRVNKLAL
jgi:hypothetical protein